MENGPFRKQSKIPVTKMKMQIPIQDEFITNPNQNAHFQTLEAIRKSRAGTLPILEWLIKSNTKAIRIFDLAYLDLLFKINRETLMVDGAALDSEFLDFDREITQSIHHYLMIKNNDHSTLHEFIEKFMSPGDKFPLIRYLNEGLRSQHPFRDILKKQDNVNDIDRLKLITEMYRLQKLCFMLISDSNEKIQMLARHAFNAIAFVIGAQYKEIKGSAYYKQLSSTSIGHIFHDYKKYLKLNRSHSPRKTKVTWHWGHGEIITLVCKTPNKYFNDENKMDLKRILAQYKEEKGGNYFVAYNNPSLNKPKNEAERHKDSVRPSIKL